MPIQGEGKGREERRGRKERHGRGLMPFLGPLRRILA